MLNGHTKSQKIGFPDQVSLNADQSAIIWTFIKLSFVIKISVLSIFEWPFYTGFTVPFFETILCLIFHFIFDIFS